MSSIVMSGNHKDQPMSALEETRTSLCDQFASVSGSDSAVAQCYLAENEWDMEVYVSIIIAPYERTLWVKVSIKPLDWVQHV